MKRSPLRRNTPKAVEWQRRKRTVLAAKSARIKVRDAVRRAPHAAQLREYPYCEPKEEGMEHECFGGLTVHEPWTKARGGPQDNRRNMISACSEANRLMSQDAECMEWAYSHGFLVHSWEGPKWLEAGGVKR